MSRVSQSKPEHSVLRVAEKLERFTGRLVVGALVSTPVDVLSYSFLPNKDRISAGSVIAAAVTGGYVASRYLNDHLRQLPRGNQSLPGEGISKYMANVEFNR